MEAIFRSCRLGEAAGGGVVVAGAEFEVSGGGVGVAGGVGPGVGGGQGPGAGGVLERFGNCGSTRDSMINALVGTYCANDHPGQKFPIYLTGPSNLKRRVELRIAATRRATMQTVTL